MRENAFATAFLVSQPHVSKRQVCTNVWTAIESCLPLAQRLSFSRLLAASPVHQCSCTVVLSVVSESVGGGSRCCAGRASEAYGDRISRNYSERPDDAFCLPECFVTRSTPSAAGNLICGRRVTCSRITCTFGQRRRLSTHVPLT